ncbi:MAG: DUF5056 domain-containing protein [Bdellovibrionales bacterium]|nr:DUF5056 domain-containing protein [Bdellovibrionales bacterium]
MDNQFDLELEKFLEVKDNGFTERVMKQLPSPAKGRSKQKNLWIWAGAVAFLGLFFIWSLGGSIPVGNFISGYYLPTAGMLCATFSVVTGLFVYR